MNLNTVKEQLSSRAKKRNRQKYLEFISLVLIIFGVVGFSGCVSNPPTTGTTPTTPIDQIPANNAISQAQSFYQTVQSDLSTASTPINEAISRGVETTSSSALVTSLQKKLSNAANLLNTALSAYNSQNYPQAMSDAQQSLAIMQDVESQLGQIQQAVKNDYQSTAAKYKPQIIEAERQYRIGEKYLEASQQVGADISSQPAKLQEAMTTLNQAKESYRNNNFIGLSGQIESITSTSQQVQSELTDLYFNAVIVNASKTVESQITVQDAKNYLSDANTLRQEKKYPDSVLSLNKALMMETQAGVSLNVGKLKLAVSSMGLDASFSALDDKVNSIKLDVTSGNFDAAGQEIEATKNDVVTTSESAAKVADASKVVDDTSRLSFWWAEKTDTGNSSAKLAEAKRFLVQGDFTSAVNAAQASMDTAANERLEFWSNVKSDWALGIFLNIAKVFSDPEKYELEPVERPQFEWNAMPDLIKIDFGRPIADVNDIVIEDPGAPIVPIFQQNASTTTPSATPQKKPIYFELDPGNPTSCGLTCRQTTATLTNTGDETAHNVKVILNIYNNAGDSIYSTQESIGDVPGGQSISKPETINADCGLFGSKCIGHTPLTLKAEVIYDEGIQTFPDQQFSG